MHAGHAGHGHALQGRAGPITTSHNRTVTPCHYGRDGKYDPGSVWSRPHAGYATLWPPQRWSTLAAGQQRVLVHSQSQEVVGRPRHWLRTGGGASGTLGPFELRDRREVRPILAKPGVTIGRVHQRTMPVDADGAVEGARAGDLSVCHE